MCLLLAVVAMPCTPSYGPSQQRTATVVVAARARLAMLLLRHHGQGMRQSRRSTSQYRRQHYRGGTVLTGRLLNGVGWCVLRRW